ncbi:aminotransferase class I/II-fold pyridoxal phosphate-dependent enzyme [Streptomyces sp. NPDC002132]|uniref:pyridoxal phosphate-dependent aminotransferase n=1 Tax=unclassified Streptomyces TaxID=2593676 RepID=UPI0033201293
MPEASVWRTSPNLALNQLVADRRAAGQDIVHLAFGESRLPAFAPLAARLAHGAEHNAYGPVAGGAPVRRAVAGYFSRRNMPTEPEQIVVGPGSKPLLMALQHVLPGDVLLPRPAWNSYVPQVRLAGKRAYEVPIPAECGGIPDPAAVREVVREARAAGGDPRVVILTLPDNPTGTLAPPAQVRELCAAAAELDLVIVSDEIYRDIIHDPATPFLSPAEVAPDRTIVTNGLSKTLALGGWRIGVCRFPGNAWGAAVRQGVVSVASEVWSTLAGPMQAVAAYAFAEPEDVRRRLAASARLHGTVAREVHRIMVNAGATCRPPTGGFYVYPDFEPLRPHLSSLGVTDSPSLQRHLLDNYGVLVLGGHHLGDDEGALRFKAATSMLYGDTAEEQEQSLAAADARSLPHVAAVLARLEEAFTKLSL